MNKPLALTIVISVVVVAALGVGAYVMKNDAKDAASVATAEAPSAAGSSETAQANKGEAFWLKRCSEEEKGYCEIFQTQSLKENNQRLLEIAVGYPAELKGEPQMVLILPLGVNVGQGVALKVGENDPAQAPYHLCNTTGCIVSSTIPKELVTQLNANTEMTVTFVDGAGQVINVPVPLAGFADALSDIKPKA